MAFVGPVELCVIFDNKDNHSTHEQNFAPAASLSCPAIDGASSTSGHFPLRNGLHRNRGHARPEKRRSEENYRTNRRNKTIISIQPPQNFSIMKAKRLLILTAIICMASLFSVDLAYAYHPVSPYAYCNGNPIKYVDPNGMEVWIYYQDDDGNEQKMLYTANMEYKGTNSFVANMVGNLNAVYINGGNTMLDMLIGSENTFNVMNQNPSIDGAAGAFRRNMDGGGTIFAGKFGSAVNFTNIETTAHEFFHGAQHELGQGGRSVFNEVEAMVFGNSVATNWSFDNGGGGSMTPMGQDTPAGWAYESAFSRLQWNGYSQPSMEQAINNFQAGAYVNKTGAYNNMRPLPVPYEGGGK